jgi:hypothetical protein
MFILRARRSPLNVSVGDKILHFTESKIIHAVTLFPTKGRKKAAN